ncbi:hypothetical protein [Spiroplasma kunkelii]|uniref:hypothetical protein n=1 Tax=Spiroplasma kunkelii TaxID=47834 RepID=UPI00130DA620|nr:hypothetical protein [Spiroplasma kunkelii]
MLTDCSNYGFLTASVLGISAGLFLLFSLLASTASFLSAISDGITSTIASICIL